MVRKSYLNASLLAVAGVLAVEATQAHPARIVFLRHGEKQSATKLCPVGELRAQALAQQYLGQGAPGNEAIFGKGGKPDAFFAITLHTQETAAPSADSWGKVPVVFPIQPKDPDEDTHLNEQTRKAAAAIEQPEYEGKTIVVVWEHKRIADKDLNKDNDTFWSLLGFGDMAGDEAPKTWKGVNYNFFWIVDYTQAQPVFHSIPQEFTGSTFRQIPANSWGEPVDEANFPEFYRNCKS